LLPWDGQKICSRIVYDPLTLGTRLGQTAVPANSTTSCTKPLLSRNGVSIALASPAVASGPERASRTGGPFVIDAFFMWTAGNSVRHHDGPGSGGVDEREHFFRNAGIVADVGPFGEPASKVCDVDILSRDDPDGELGGTGIVRAIERDGGDRVAAKSSFGSFAQPLACTLEHALVVAHPVPCVKVRERDVV
jgi:hypothetical protein